MAPWRMARPGAAIKAPTDADTDRVYIHAARPNGTMTVRNPPNMDPIVSWPWAGLAGSFHGDGNISLQSVAPKKLLASSLHTRNLLSPSYSRGYACKQTISQFLD